MLQVNSVPSHSSLKPLKPQKSGSYSGLDWGFFGIQISLESVKDWGSKEHRDPGQDYSWSRK